MGRYALVQPQKEEGGDDTRTDEDAEHMLGGTLDSWAFRAEYGRLRGDGMPIEQAMIFVGHRFRMWHLGHLPLEQTAGKGGRWGKM